MNAKIEVWPGSTTGNIRNHKEALAVPMAVADRIQEWYTKEGTVNYQSFISEVSHGLGNSDGGARNIPTRRSSLEEQIHGQLFDANFV